MSDTAQILHGVQVLVVEDEAILSMILQDFLEELGCVIIGPAQALPEALSHAEEAKIDIALIDVNLQRVEAFPVADVLVRRGIPFIFMSGDDDLRRNDTYGTRPVLRKPFAMREVPLLVHSVLYPKAAS
jgi:DNA-binding response OmpR family regulator